MAVSVRGGKAIGFVCTTSGTATWLSGAAGAGLFQLSGPGRARLTGSYLDHRATGRALAHGVQYRFAIPRVHQAGLHAAIAGRTAAACQPPAAPVGNGRRGRRRWGRRQRRRRPPPRRRLNHGANGAAEPPRLSERLTQRA